MLFSLLSLFIVTSNSPMRRLKVSEMCFMILCCFFRFHNMPVKACAKNRPQNLHTCPTLITARLIVPIKETLLHNIKSGCWNDSKGSTKRL
ncbi:hypothetical protein O6H91_04G068900 [Diphasiastrum complanatum]|uniref:Uncharacterized protein n=1 Tax=Diphasiastrum complanatum TaxID=34168 RepID=A0ACC2DXU7_DIPCM|nr:hypothetical protein O6H91_04G068900 [Diphasiastrum complanatum]